MSLTRLTIQNIVLIDKLIIDFHDGLCALTGETGAGKSILLDSLGLAIGARADSGLLRHGADKASVTAEFDLAPSHAIYALLENNDVTLDSLEPLILRRTLTDDGRSRAYINDEPVSAKLLKQAGTTLIEIHGQFDTQGLLDASTHASMLDEYAGIDGALQKSWQAYAAQKLALKTLKEDLEKSRAEEDYLRSAIEDLDALNPQVGEEAHLTDLRQRLQNRERVLDGLSQAHQALLSENDPVRSALSALDRIADMLGEQGQGALSALDRAIAEIEEASSQIQSLSYDLQDEEHYLETIDERLFKLKAQARKHDCPVDELAQKREDLAASLNLIEHAEGALAEQIRKTDEAFAAYKKQAQAVSEKRKKTAQDLDQKIALELEPLKLGKAHFVTDIKSLPEEQWGPRGMDEIQFLVATNPGQAPGALRKIASGGEMSRFMLALKVVMAEIGSAQSLIFDEVDAGIGGSTADAVGERLAALAASKQVLVVTHAPQVAARASHHYIVEKAEQSGAVKTSVRHLPDDQDRQEEIARMLAGADITNEARAAATRLLENAA